MMWGKIIGGVAGFAVGGPFGAVAGMALGHAADSNGMAGLRNAGRNALGGMLGQARTPFAAAPALGREQVFAMGVVVLAAKPVVAVLLILLAVVVLGILRRDDL